VKHFARLPAGSQKRWKSPKPYTKSLATNVDVSSNSVFIETGARREGKAAREGREAEFSNGYLIAKKGGVLDFAGRREYAQGGI